MKDIRTGTSFMPRNGSGGGPQSNHGGLRQNAESVVVRKP